MLYIIHLILILVWLVVLIRKRKISWHSIVTAYVIAVFMVDFMEVLFNLLLDFYKFPTHLINNPIFDNQLGIIFADTLILPFTAIIFVYYNRESNPWITSILFFIGHVILELLYLKLGYLSYNNWNTVYSAIFYFLGFRLISYLASKIVHYEPPIYYPIRLFCFAYTSITWIGAILGMPVLKLYQFNLGLFNDFMADDRFVDLYSGVVLAMMCAFIVTISNRRRTLLFVLIAFIGVLFAFYSYSRGWLMYHYWNHPLMVLRYIVPFALIVLYDRWELSYKTYLSTNKELPKS